MMIVKGTGKRTLIQRIVDMQELRKAKKYNKRLSRTLGNGEREV